MEHVVILYVSIHRMRISDILDLTPTLLLA